MSNKADQLISFALNNGGNITSEDTKKLLSNTYYCNGDKHVGEVLSRLVKSGKMQRVKRGVFKLISATKRTIQDHPSQTKLI